MDDERHYVMRQREILHAAVIEAIRLDPDWVEKSMIPRGWVLAVDLVGQNDPEDDTVGENFRGQAVAHPAVYSSDALGDSDLPPYVAEGFLRYVSAHYEELYDSMGVIEDEEDND